MKNRITPFLLLLACIQFFSCTEDEGQPLLPLTDTQVLVNQEAYDSAPRDFLVINSLKIDGDFLTVNFSSSGCSGESWEVRLIDSGMLMYSFPPQRHLVLSLKNEELCEAYITKELTFDISALRVEGDRVLLHFPDSGQSIVYSY